MVKNPRPKLLKIGAREYDVLEFILRRVKEGKNAELVNTRDQACADSLHRRLQALNSKSRYCSRCEGYFQIRDEKESVDEFGLCRWCADSLRKFWKKAFDHAKKLGHPTP